jgi:hypothetical protein
MHCIIKKCMSANPESGKFTMIMHLPMQPSFCGNYQINAVHRRDGLTTHQISVSPCEFSSVRKLRKIEKGKIFYVMQQQEPGQLRQYSV